jgi:1-acyl-sn-glycerol-3-phosphate acyltransferase
MLLRVESVLFWAFLTLSSILLFPVAAMIWALTLPFDRKKVVLHQFTCLWASLYTWANPAWPVRVLHRERLHKEGATVMVANHLSLLDILVLFRLFHHFKWVSKIENFRIPCVGWNMSLNGYIKLRRGDKTSVLEMLRQCEEAIAVGNSIMMFPEGTRSPSGRMRSFKPGAFEVAKKTGVPIQPLVIQGTADALPKAGFLLKGKHRISITILDPIPPERFSVMSVEELTLHVRDVIHSHLDEPTRDK